MPESKVEAVYSVRSHIASTGVVPRSRATELLGRSANSGWSCAAGEDYMAPAKTYPTPPATAGHRIRWR